MKFNRKKKIVSGALACVLAVLAVSGCANEPIVVEPMEKKESYAFGFDIAGGDDVMPIAGYYGPYASFYTWDGQSVPNYISDEVWAAIAECGVNVMTHSITDYNDAPREVLKNLDYGEKYNIAVVVTDSGVKDMADLEQISKEDMTLRLSEYMNHPAFAGLYLVDEPYTSYFMMAADPERDLYRYETIAPLINEELGIFTYMNSMGSGNDEQEKEVFEKFLNEYCDVLHPSYLQFDRYPFDANQTGMESRYFYDLSIIRKVAQERELPFWCFVQAGSQWNDAQDYFDSTEYYPNEGEFDWNINICLAFGAQGISYFPLIQPYYFAYAKSEPLDSERNGILGVLGNKTRWFYYAKDMSTHIQAVDEVLMNSVSEGILAFGEEPIRQMSLADESVKLKGTSWRELKSVSGDALVGCFNYQGKTALYVVNYSTEYAQKIDLTFQDDYLVTVIQDGQTNRYRCSDMTLDLAAGEGTLLVFGGQE